jgi:hypothetical protein
MLIFDRSGIMDALQHYRSGAWRGTIVERGGFLKNVWRTLLPKLLPNSVARAGIRTNRG